MTPYPRRHTRDTLDAIGGYHKYLLVYICENHNWPTVADACAAGIRWGQSRQLRGPADC